MVILHPLTSTGEPRSPAVSVNARLRRIPGGVRLSVLYGGSWPTLDSYGWYALRGVVYFHRMTTGRKRRLWVDLERVR